MRKMMRLVHDDDRELVVQINNAYQKLEKAGYKIISTQIIKSMYTKFVAFIEYEIPEK